LRASQVISEEDKNKAIRMGQIRETVAKRETVAAIVKKYEKVRVLLGEYNIVIVNINAVKIAPEEEDIMNDITERIKTAIKNKKGDDDNGVKNEIQDGINYILGNPAGTKYNLISLLLTLRKLILYENEQDSLKGKVDLDNADNLLVLLKTYTKICDRNIGKFDRLFKQNDIVDIDEAFMIESYATFLNKLKKLKRNLESKDKGKLERALTKSLDKLFNLYGINDYEKLINTDDAAAPANDAQKYFMKLIDDY
jgi:hypothetical protein